ncbi:hypothetical protein KJ909_03555, partial [Patescibacteria group bacterium]|nr:hypothetical protein [Patescibacteria group bacterium]
ESEGKKIAGMINVPWLCHSGLDPESQIGEILNQVQDDKEILNSLKGPTAVQDDRCGVIVMIRGYADKEGYYTGSGSWRVADELAKVGLVTVSLDFLGFGGSDEESLDMLEARFEKVPAILDLIASVQALDFVDAEKIGIWAHSNGGQIALSVGEILGERIPMVLWAPMTNPFPASVLETVDDLDDGGKAVKKAISDFEKYYDIRRYVFENYYDWVNFPLVIHQGTADYWCKMEWQKEVERELIKRNKTIKLYQWRGDDHNLSKNWEEIVKLDAKFFFGEFE